MTDSIISANLIQIVWYADAVGVNASDEYIDCMRVIV